MSFRIQPAAPARPNRCQLFGPGSRPAIFEKMAASDFRYSYEVANRAIHILMHEHSLKQFEFCKAGF